MEGSVGRSGMQSRFEVAAALHEIGARLELTARGPARFKARAYERAARSVEALNADIGDLVREGRLTSVPGIGDAIASVVAELVQTGQSTLLEKLRASMPPGALELAAVPGLTTKR